MPKDKEETAAPGSAEMPEPTRTDSAEPEPVGAGGRSKEAVGQPGENPLAPNVHFSDEQTDFATVVESVRKSAPEGVILVPVDFSAPSEAALLFAAKLAEKTSTPLLLLHVVHDPGEMPGYYAKMFKKKRLERIQDVAKEVFEDFVEQVIAENPDLESIRDAQALMVIGLPVTRILQVAEKVEPFMVVMGSKGLTGLKHLFLGSKAEQVVHLCPAPVTIIKDKK